MGHDRNDLRQLAVGLLWLEKRGYVAIPDDIEGVVNSRQARSPLATTNLPGSRGEPLLRQLGTEKL